MEDFYFVAAVPSGFENGLFEARQAHFYNHSMSLIFLAAAGYLWKFISLNQVISGIFNQTSVATLNIKQFQAMWIFFYLFEIEIDSKQI